MGHQDRTFSVQDLLHLTSGTHDGPGDATPLILLVGGKYVAQPTAVAGGDVAILWVSPEGYARPHVTAASLYSFTTASTNGTSSAVTGLGVFKEADVLVDVTSVSGTSPTLDLYIDGRLAGGTAWVNVARLTQITTANQIAVHLSKAQGTNTEVSVTSDAGAGTLRRIGWGDAMRVRRVIGGTGPSISATVYANYVP